jgi:hypothetical protein
LLSIFGLQKIRFNHALIHQKRETHFHKKKVCPEIFSSAVYREIITSSQKRISITLPHTLVGKTVEVFAFELHTTAEASPDKRVSMTDFWETFGSGKGSSISMETIRQRAWRKY